MLVVLLEVGTGCNSMLIKNICKKEYIQNTILKRVGPLRGDDAILIGD